NAACAPLSSCNLSVTIAGRTRSPTFSRSSMFRPSFLLLLAAIPAYLTAQHGDTPGEAMPPPPATWQIPPAPALSVNEALETFQLVPGFRLEVVAAEPLVRDPVAMIFGPDGRIWVAEMRGYMP